MFVDLSILVCSSQQNHILRILYLERKQKKQSFNTFITSVNIISQKQIVSTFDVSEWWFINGSSKSLKKSVNLMKLTMNVSKYFDGCSQLHIRKNTLTNIGSSSRIFSNSLNSSLMYSEGMG